MALRYIKVPLYYDFKTNERLAHIARECPFSLRVSLCVFASYEMTYTLHVQCEFLEPVPWNVPVNVVNSKGFSVFRLPVESGVNLLGVKSSTREKAYKNGFVALWGGESVD